MGCQSHNVLAAAALHSPNPTHEEGTASAAADSHLGPNAVGGRWEHHSWVGTTRGVQDEHREANELVLERADYWDEHTDPEGVEGAHDSAGAGDSREVV